MPKIILIADDDDNIRDLIYISLEDEGYNLHTARNGEEALKMALEIKPDLVILDVMMPGKTGYEVCEALKKNPATCNTYVIFLSARGSPISEKTGKMKGGNEFLIKPFDPEILKAKVRDATR